jgi:hypothetical protein
MIQCTLIRWMANGGTRGVVRACGCGAVVGAEEVPADIWASVERLYQLLPPSGM